MPLVPQDRLRTPGRSSSGDDRGDAQTEYERPVGGGPVNEYRRHHR